MANSFFFEIGIMILLAFIGAYLAGRFRQSVIVGYIFVGVLIGPNIHIDLAGFEYSGLIVNQEFIQQLSKLGLMFLLFFTGLGFSVSALRTTWKPAVLLAISDVLLNLFIGFIIGALFGWPIQDSLFLAAIVGMSSVAVAAKSADDERMLYRKEYNYLFTTMIVEDFISILLLTFSSTFVLGDILSPDEVGAIGAGMVIIYAFFIILALFIAPRAFHYFEKIQGNELFVLFALSVVFLSSAFADYLRIPPAIGAFLVGMAFAETSLRDKLATQMLSMKDAFVAIFFVSFGMLVDTSVLVRVAPIMALAVSLVIVNEVMLLGALAYLLGFTRRAAISISTGFLGRGEDAVLFASVGTSLHNPQTGQPLLVKAPELSPFAGGFCFIMSGLTPAMMRAASRISDGLAKVVPESIKFGGGLISRVVRPIVMTSSFLPDAVERRLLALVIGYGAAIVVSLIVGGWWHWAASLAALVLLSALWYVLSEALKPHTRSLDLQDLDVLRPDRESIHRFIVLVIGLLFALMLPPPALWSLSWGLAVALNCIIALVILVAMVHIHSSLRVRPKPITKERILHSEKPRRIGEGASFSPKKKRVRASPPTRARKAPKIYVPVPKEALVRGLSQEPKKKLGRGV